MISITCNQCKAVLTIDDAFAGGVCRCQHCGTIQTVPAHFKGNAPVTPVVSPSANTQKNLFPNQTAGRTSGGNSGASSASPGGLDELAQVVASSGGLVGSGLTSGRLQSGAAGTAVAAAPMVQADATASPPLHAASATKLPMAALAIGGGLAALAVVGVILFFVMRGGGDSSTGGGGGSSGGSGANFGGVPLSGNSVVYVLDRANSMRDEFDPIKAATYQSIKSLGPDRKFAVLLWNNGGDDIFFPPQGLRNANSDQVDQLQKSIEDVQATGSSKLGGALDTAIGRQPAAIVIVTAKNKFEDDDQAEINSALDKTSGKIKVYALVIGSGGENNFLKAAVKGTGGQYKQVTGKDLRATSP